VLGAVITKLLFAVYVVLGKNMSYTVSKGTNFGVGLYFKNSLLELRILLSVIGLVKEPMGLQLGVEI